ncbi:MAG: sugar phosphate isomerase/epimerase [Bryobacterales bacterium]|nr:sugar phosphate isomerase/epimerase [Bryobacterales bacterium]
MQSTRRSFLASAVAAAPLFAKSANVPFHLGVATYSLRKLSRSDAIAAIKKMGVTHVSVKEYHLRYNSTPEELASGRKEFEAAGLKIMSGGNIDLKGDEAKIRAMFDYAKGAGMPMIVCAPSQATIPAVEKMVKEYNIRVAIHNHGPEDKFFPDPQSVLEAIKGRDPRMGLCVDIGHTARTGRDVVESIRLAGKRLFDLHVKDLKDLKDKAAQVAVGEGAMPMKEIFATLKKMNFRGGCMLEYEINADNPVPGMIQSFDHMRKLLAEMPS